MDTDRRGASALSQQLAAFRLTLTAERGRLSDVISELDNTLICINESSTSDQVSKRTQQCAEDEVELVEDCVDAPSSPATVSVPQGLPGMAEAPGYATMEAFHKHGPAITAVTSRSMTTGFVKGSCHDRLRDSAAAPKSASPFSAWDVGDEGSDQEGALTPRQRLTRHSIGHCIQERPVMRLESIDSRDPSKLRKAVTAQTLRSPISTNGPSQGLFKRQGGKATLRLSVSDARDRECARLFADADAMKEAVQQAILQPDFDIKDLYKRDGVVQAVARSHIFEFISFAAIALNAIWLAIETDNNDQPVLLYAAPEFIAIENFFCAFFTFELLIRFLAFEDKRDVVRDRWFFFDSILVFTMILETWVFTFAVLVTGGSAADSLTAESGSSSVLRILRLCRLTRAARIARILKAMPEVQVILHGVMIVTRTVIVIICLLCVIVYVFAIMFTQLAKGTPLENTICPDVLTTMGTLLLGGILPDMQPTTAAFADEHILYACFFFIFVLMAFVTIMNMLIGVLVEVVSVVAAVEKETNQVAAVKKTMLKWAPRDGDDRCGKSQFYTMLHDPGCVKDLNDVGVDAIAMIDYAEYLFRDKEFLTFAELLAVVLGLRGRNDAKVNDLVQLRKFLQVNMRRLETSVDDLQSLMLKSLDKHGRVKHGDVSRDSTERSRSPSKGRGTLTAVSHQIRHNRDVVIFQEDQDVPDSPVGESLTRSFS